MNSNASHEFAVQEDEDRIIERLLAQSEARRHLLARLEGEPAACLNGMLRELHNGWPDDPGSLRSMVVAVNDLPKGHDFKDWAHQLKASRVAFLCQHSPGCLHSGGVALQARSLPKCRVHTCPAANLPCPRAACCLCLHAHRSDCAAHQTGLFIACQITS